MKDDSFSDESESVACTSSAVNHKKTVTTKASVSSGSSITITKISAITKNNTPLMNNANINLKTPLINRKPLILVGKSNRTLRKSPRLKKMKENNESLI